MYFLAHGDYGWIMSGFVVFIGIMVFAIKFGRGQYVSLFLSACVWIFVFKIHSGSTQGIMTATFAALLFDLVGIPLFKLLTFRR